MRHAPILIPHPSPFRFLNLPGEIRNEIYKYASTMPPIALKKPKKPRNSAPNPPLSGLSDAEKHSFEKENLVSTQLPALFLTCSQIHTESRLLFYRHHVFKFRVWYEEQNAWLKLAKRLRFYLQTTCLERVIGWLDAIGPQARKQIRKIEIELHCDDLREMGNYAPFVHDLHARLPDEATVVYRSASRYLDQQVLLLKELGKKLFSGDPIRLARLGAAHWFRKRGGASPWEVYLFQLYDEHGRRREEEGPSLTFGPGQGWFGGVSRSSSLWDWS